MQSGKCFQGLPEPPEGDSALRELALQLTDVNWDGVGSSPGHWDGAAVPARVSDGVFFNGETAHGNKNTTLGPREGSWCKVEVRIVCVSKSEQYQRRCERKSACQVLQ